MTNKKEKRKAIKKWISDNIVAIMIPVLAGLIALIRGLYNRLYLQNYYGYFDIDIIYVDTKYFSDVKGTLLLLFLLFVVSACSYGVYKSFLKLDIKREYYKKINVDKTASPKVIKYIKKEMRIDTMAWLISSTLHTFVILFCMFFVFKAMGIQREEQYGILKQTAVIAAVLTGFVMLFTCMLITDSKRDEQVESKMKEKINSKKIDNIYKSIFPKDDNDESDRKIQIDIIKGYYDNSEDRAEYKTADNIQFLLIILAAVMALMVFKSREGFADAINQREFLVTEDNQHVAVPVSKERYALIDIREEGDSLVLLMGKQNFHESNGFPCKRKTYKNVRKEQME